jgi:uncharacterized protein (DUF362 family)/ferredoxin
MQPFGFNKSNVYLARHTPEKSIRDITRDFLQTYNQVLPTSLDATILIKPNLNNDLTALTGNSTDLRLLAAVLRFLTEAGYTNITIADGPNVGIDRKKIDVFGRLGVRRLAEQFGVRLVNLNDEPGVEVELTTSKARVARICLEADFIIALPKIKTHAEAGMSLACKLLVGCVVGQDKKRVHDDLIPNILRLNEIIKPDLYIVDGLIAMEGNGPGDGHPRRLDLLMAGTDPLQVDLVGARLVGFELEEIPHLRLAYAKGRISTEEWQTAQGIEPVAHIEKPPPRKLSTRILGHNVFAGLRDATRPLHGARVVQRLLYKTGVIQDVYEIEDARLAPLTLDREACTGCGACLSFCPLELPITTPDFDFSDGRCVECLCCAFVCPEGAIPLIGELGYLAAHLERYGEEMRQLGREEASRLHQEAEMGRVAA